MLWSGQHLSVTFRQDDGTETPALRDVSLDIDAGERIVVVGPNGSGKSTLGLLLAGLIKPSAGTILLNGHTPASPTGAIVFQNPDDNLIGATVHEELRLALEQSVPLNELEKAMKSTLERFDLARLADRETERLSGGEKQRVAVACAIISGQPLIVLDEPTSHLDPPGKREFWRFIENLHPRSISFPALIVVTQYAGEVHHFPRVVELDNGRVKYNGPTSGSARPREQASEPLHVEPMPNAEVILSVRNLNQMEAPGWPLPENPIRRVSLDIRTGESIAVCGPIGSGKTTLAFLLAGLLKGHSEYFQSPPDPPVVLIQFPERQMFCSTVLDEVAYGLRARGFDQLTARARARDALRIVGLTPEEFETRSPFSLSGGQKRRVMLAVAAALDALLYILDEPQAALDEDGLRALTRLCAEWSRRGAADLLISHDLDFLRPLTSRVLILDHGRITYDGTWSQLDAVPKPLVDIGFMES